MWLCPSSSLLSCSATDKAIARVRKPDDGDRRRLCRGGVVAFLSEYSGGRAGTGPGSRLRMGGDLRSHRLADLSECLRHAPAPVRGRHRAHLPCLPIDHDWNCRGHGFGAKRSPEESVRRRFYSGGRLKCARTRRLPSAAPKERDPVPFRSHSCATRSQHP